MPTEAPGAQGPQVAPGVQPGIQMAEQMPLSAAGGGPERERQAMLGNEASQHLGMAIQMKVIQANMASAAQRENAYMQKADDLLQGTDQNPGLLRLKGSNAIDAYPAVQKQLQEYKQKLQDSAPNDDVNRMLSGSLGQKFTNYDGTIQKHIGEQLTAVAVQQDLNGKQEFLKQAGTSSAGPGGIDGYLSLRQDAINTMRRNGITIEGVKIDSQGNHIQGPDGKPLPADATQVKIDAQVQAMDAAHVEGLLMNGKPHAAQAFMEHPDIQNDMSKNQKLAETLSDKVGNAVAQDKAYHVTGPDLFRQHGLNDLAGALKATEKLPEEYGERQRTREAVKQIYEDNQKHVEEMDKLEKGADWDYWRQHGSMRPGISIERETDMRKIINNYETHAKVGKDDTELKMSITDMAYSADPKERAQFSAMNLAAPEYASRLTPSTLESLTKVQRSLQNPDKGAYQQAAIPYQQQQQVGNEVMRHMGWDPEQPNNKDVPQFRQDLDTRIKQAESIGGKKLDYDGMCEIATKMRIDRLAGRPAPVATATVTPGPIAEASEIPAAQRAKLMGVLKASGMAQTEENILKLQQTYESQNAR